MKISRPSPSMVVAGIALFVSLGGTSVAAVNYATNARAPSTARAPSSRARRSTRPRASSSPPTAPGRTRAGSPASSSPTWPKTQSFSRGYEVADNAPGAPQLVSTIKGLGTLTATCNDQNTAAGNEDPISVITFNNASGQTVNVARRVGNGDGALTLAAEPDRDVAQHRRLEHVLLPHRVRGPERDHQGGVRQDGRGTPAAVCGVFGVVIQIQCLLAGPVPIEGDHLLDAARPVRVADRRR